MNPSLSRESQGAKVLEFLFRGQLGVGGIDVPDGGKTLPGTQLRMEFCEESGRAVGGSSAGASRRVLTFDRRPPGSSRAAVRPLPTRPRSVRWPSSRGIAPTECGSNFEITPGIFRCSTWESRPIEPPQEPTQSVDCCPLRLLQPVEDASRPLVAVFLQEQLAQEDRQFIRARGRLARLSRTGGPGFPQRPSNRHSKCR